jgi:hypothetical protein
LLCPIKRVVSPWIVLLWLVSELTVSVSPSSVAIGVGIIFYRDVTTVYEMMGKRGTPKAVSLFDAKRKMEFFMYWSLMWYSGGTHFFSCYSIWFLTFVRHQEKNDAKT